jgi:hypothetical protein
MDSQLSPDIEAPPATVPLADIRSHQAYTSLKTGGNARVHAGNAYYRDCTISKSPETYCIGAVTNCRYC